VGVGVGEGVGLGVGFCVGFGFGFGVGVVVAVATAAVSGAFGRALPTIAQRLQSMMTPMIVPHPMVPNFFHPDIALKRCLNVGFVGGGVPN